MTQKASFRRLIRRIHNNEEGAVSIETILIIGAIAIPVLIFILKVAWPRIQEYWHEGIDELGDSAQDART